MVGGRNDDAVGVIVFDELQEGIQHAPDLTDFIAGGSIRPPKPCQRRAGDLALGYGIIGMEALSWGGSLRRVASLALPLFVFLA